MVFLFLAPFLSTPLDGDDFDVFPFFPAWFDDDVDADEQDKAEADDEYDERDGVVLEEHVK